MSRQNTNRRNDRKNEEQRKGPAQHGVRSYSENNQHSGFDRNRTDNTRIAGLDKNRLNDLYERSSI